MDVTRTALAIRKLLERAELAFRQGQSRSQVCELLEVTEEELRIWLDKYGGHPNMCGPLTDSPLHSAVCPVFHEGAKAQAMEQIGSGVLLRIGTEVFLLTAAHVTDYFSAGRLLIPGADGITPLDGYFSDNPPPENLTRNDDKVDIAYVRLAVSLHEHLHPSLRPAGIDDLLLSDDLEDGDFFTFVGYPWRKAKCSRGKRESEIATYSGHAVSKEKYDALEYSRAAHIVILFRRKKTFSTLYKSVQVTPLPQGISGGAVLSWPRTLSERINNPILKIAGIGHSYHASDHCMAATRVIPYLHAIVRNNPQLKEHVPRLPD